MNISCYEQAREACIPSTCRGGGTLFYKFPEKPLLLLFKRSRKRSWSCHFRLQSIRCHSQRPLWYKLGSSWVWNSICVQRLGWHERIRWGPRWFCWRLPCLGETLLGSSQHGRPGLSSGPGSGASWSSRRTGSCVWSGRLLRAHRHHPCRTFCISETWKLQNLYPSVRSWRRRSVGGASPACRERTGTHLRSHSSHAQRSVCKESSCRYGYFNLALLC